MDHSTILYAVIIVLFVLSFFLALSRDKAKKRMKDALGNLDAARKGKIRAEKARVAMEIAKNQAVEKIKHLESKLSTTYYSKSRRNEDGTFKKVAKKKAAPKKKAVNKTH